MDNLWNEKKANACKNDLDLRVYSSNLLGQNDELVLHGGGNTSLKNKIDGEDVLHVKGSGWDLASIKAEGFAPVKLDALLEMAKLPELSDSEMVRLQREAMIDKSAPNPSVEAILHALIPYKFVDHTHADAIVTISNSVNGDEHIVNLFPNFLIVDYVMPGFELAHKIYEMTKDLDWESIDGIILHHHGIFTFDNDAKKSYDKMIEAVIKAEDFLDEHALVHLEHNYVHSDCDIGKITKVLSRAKGYDVSININQSPLASFYASQENLKEFASRGVLTPEHIIRTKRVPLIMEDTDLEGSIERYIKEYRAYFNKYAKDEVMLNPAPNYMIIKNLAVISFGKTREEAAIINDIVNHTMLAVLRADKLGGYQSISEEESFQMEYWELEQAKLKK
ncbi:class II aldolase/adducin family protein [Sulfurimonas autotrophica]|uniref:Class II aldolase/adducin family protein n=1 Tax=Sulfurimonas autotrophica (strain ATCC BAA-671 / DSM 16294 / JCM 11897 / OK10) TaxID=563040 RepID=E0UUR1_SULAO|nr:class II aldolase/adducin family protein [Sulfurimonas autotrophica]ADN09565.1 class II aldolase/adducin family protein [Sulfurimonas autotrophica DSM 16294]